MVGNGEREDDWEEKEVGGLGKASGVRGKGIERGGREVGLA